MTIFFILVLFMPFYFIKRYKVIEILFISILHVIQLTCSFRIIIIYDLDSKMLKMEQMLKIGNAICPMKDEIWQLMNAQLQVIKIIIISATKFIAFLRFRCQIVIFLAILPSLATKSAKNLKFCFANALYRDPRQYRKLRVPPLQVVLELSNPRGFFRSRCWYCLFWLPKVTISTQHWQCRQSDPKFTKKSKNVKNIFQYPQPK